MFDVFFLVQDRCLYRCSVFLLENIICWLPRRKTMRNHPDISEKNSFLKPKRLKFHEKSEFGHVHEHQKLQVTAKPSRKTCPFFV